MEEYKRDGDLYKNKNYYSIEYLKENINNFSLWAILHTQILTPDFCVEYLLVPDNKYAKDEDDEDIYINNVLYWQRHITKEDLLNCEFMKKYKVNDVNIDEVEKLKFDVRNRTCGYTKKTLRENVYQYFTQNKEVADKLLKHLETSRVVKEAENLKRVRK